MEKRAPTRKTRIVCVSDTHGASPKDGAFKLPKGDVLIHAGDLTNQGSYGEIKKTISWIAEADFEVKIVVAGNHDLSLDHDFATSHDPHPHECLGAARVLIKSHPSILYLEHEAATIRLTSPDGPQTTFRVFGSPYSPTRGQYAFSYPPCPSGAHVMPFTSSSTVSSAAGSTMSSLSAEQLWSHVPLDTDILITHTPPYGVLDQSPKWGVAGCQALLRRMWEVRPALHICGHVHEGRGAEVVKWGLEVARAGEIADRRHWNDPGRPSMKLAADGADGIAIAKSRGGRQKKMSLVDLTGRKVAGEGGLTDSKTPLANDCSTAKGLSKLGLSDLAIHSRRVGSLENHYSFSAPKGTAAGTRKGRLHHERVACFAGREGRAETAVVNCAIMAKSHGLGKKTFNQPIVVDIDLPVCSAARAPVEAEHLEIRREATRKVQIGGAGRGIDYGYAVSAPYTRETELESEESIVQECIAPEITKIP